LQGTRRRYYSDRRQDAFPLESWGASCEECRGKGQPQHAVSRPFQRSLRERSADQSSRVAASASSASWFTTWKNFGVCPTNNPSLVNDAMVATAPPNLSLLVTVVSPGGQRERLLVKGTERHHARSIFYPVSLRSKPRRAVLCRIGEHLERGNSALGAANKFRGYLGWHQA
jgi:hypothetical protein